MRMLALPEARELAARAVAEKGADYCLQLNPPFSEEDCGCEAIGVEDSGGHGEDCPWENWSSCVYFVEDQESPSREWQPSCIVGHILYYLGLTGARLVMSLNSNAMPISSLDERHTGIVWTPAVGEYLSELQAWQDKGYSWGTALEHAEDLVTRRGDTL